VIDILGRLDAAATPQAMDVPGYRLHPLKDGLKGSRKNESNIKVDRQPLPPEVRVA
jgi:hypothetical protein